MKLNNESSIIQIQICIFVRVQCMTWVQCPWADFTAQLVVNILHLGIAFLDQEWEEIAAFHSKKLTGTRDFYSSPHREGSQFKKIYIVHWGPTRIVLNALCAFFISFPTYQVRKPVLRDMKADP